MNVNFFFDMKKPSNRFSKRGRGEIGRSKA